METTIGIHYDSAPATLWNLANTPYRPKVLVGFNQDWFIEVIAALGGDEYLEDQKIFALLFDTSKNVEDVVDYQEVLDRYPMSNRVATRKWYIGNLDGKPMDIVEKVLVSIFGWQPEIVYLEGGFTKTPQKHSPMVAVQAAGPTIRFPSHVTP